MALYYRSKPDMIDLKFISKLFIKMFIYKSADTFRMPFLRLSFPFSYRLKAGCLYVISNTDLHFQQLNIRVFLGGGINY